MSKITQLLFAVDAGAARRIARRWVVWRRIGVAAKDASEVERVVFHAAYYIGVRGLLYYRYFNGELSVHPVQ